MSIATKGHKLNDPRLLANKGGIPRGHTFLYPRSLYPMPKKISLKGIVPALKAPSRGPRDSLIGWATKKSKDGTNIYVGVFLTKKAGGPSRYQKRVSRKYLEGKKAEGLPERKTTKGTASPKKGVKTGTRVYKNISSTTVSSHPNAKIRAYFESKKLGITDGAVKYISGQLLHTDSRYLTGLVRAAKVSQITEINRPTAAVYHKVHWESQLRNAGVASTKKARSVMIDLTPS